MRKLAASKLGAAVRAATRSILDFLRGFTGMHAAKLAIHETAKADVRGEVRKTLTADAEQRPRCC